ncbi:hypothetical protein FKM82_023846 [Ascaphus truei]
MSITAPATNTRIHSLLSDVRTRSTATGAYTVCLRVSTDGVPNRTHFKYVQQLQDSLQQAYQLAEKTSAHLNAGNKRHYDHKFRHREIRPGDAVLLHNLGIPGKHKLAVHWRDGV